MIFKQSKNGDCDIIFNEKEINILNKRKKITLSAHNFRDFSNNLIKVIAEFHQNLPEEEKERMTQSGHVKTND